MRRGYVESALPLLLFVGVTGSGKTLFKRLLLGQSVPEFSPSTPLAESAIRAMSVCKVAVEGIEWDIVGPEHMMSMVANAIKKVPLLKSNWKDSSQIAFDGENTQRVPEENVEPPENTALSSFSTSFAKVAEEIKIDSHLYEAMKESSTNIVGKLMEVNFLYLLDSGGQPPFREMLPHFVRKADAIVLMMKLNERLDFKPIIKFREEGQKISRGYESELTNEQILHQYIQAVQSHDSRVFVVGTHMDLESECESETREMKNKKLLEAIRPILGKKMILYRVGEPNQLIFPVNCMSRESDAKEVAQAFRERVIVMCQDEKVKIPLSWFVLDQLLKLLSEKKKVSVLSTEECLQAAQQKLLMPSNVCISALNYLGKLNIIFYRPDILPQVVFSNAQVLLDKITELVRCSHALRTKNEDSGSNVPSYMNSGEGLQFRDFGQVNAQLLKFAFPSHYKEYLFDATDFLKLLEGLLIAAKLKDGNHFIPSLLPDLSKDKISEYRVTSEDNLAPLVFHYPKMWLPVGVMPSLVVYLINICSWNIHVSGKQRKPSCLYHNCIMFQLYTWRGAWKCSPH